MGGEILADKLYTVEEVGALLGGVHRRTVWRMLRKGVLKGRHIGRRWYVLGRDILAAGTEPQAEEPKADKRVVLRKQEPRAKPKRKKVKPKASLADLVGPATVNVEELVGYRLIQ